MINRVYKTHKTEVNDDIHVYLTFGGAVVGLPLISPQGNLKHFNENSAFLLMHMAQKLDNVYGGNGFSSVVKNFARTELLKI